MAPPRRVRQLDEVEPAQLRRFTDEVSELIDQRLPMMFDADDDWPLIAHGFLARSGELMEAITALVEHGHGGEAQMLLRIMFEHVATFCWLAIDPVPHVLRWREWAKARQLKTHKEAQKFGIKNVLNAAEVREAEGSQPPIPLPQMAEQIDRYWSEHSTAFRPYDDSDPDDPPSILTFSGFYTAVYRKASNLIHADIASPDRFASMPLQGHVTIHKTEQHTESNDYPAFSGALIGFLLIVFGDRFGWPERELTEGITNGLIYAD
jgi:hypothetical protein